MTEIQGKLYSNFPFFAIPLLFLLFYQTAANLSQDRHNIRYTGTYVAELGEVKRDIDGDGVADLLGDTITVAGRSNIGSGILHEHYLQIFIQDNDYGLSLFAESVDEAVSSGDSIVATGVVQEYYGLTELKVIDYKVVPAETKRVSSLPLSSAMKNLKRHEGLLVSGTGTVVGKGSRYNGKYLLLSPSGTEGQTIMAYVTNFHSFYQDFDFESISTGDEIKVSGVLSRYNPTTDTLETNNYKIHLRTPADFSVIGLSINQMILGGSLALGLIALVVGWIISLRSTVKNKTKELEQSLHEKEILLKEIHHRVKNNLAIMSGLFELQLESTDSKETEKALRNSQSRLQSMALVHDKLYQTSSLSKIDMAHYIPDLVESLHDAFSSSTQAVDLQFDIDNDLHLDIDHAIPCGLLINEIVVNAFKHAFSRYDEAVISVSMHRHGKQISLAVADNGRGIPENFELGTSTSLGMMLIETFRDQLDASLEISSDNGTRFTLVFTVD